MKDSPLFFEYVTSGDEGCICSWISVAECCLQYSRNGVCVNEEFLGANVEKIIHENDIIHLSRPGKGELLRCLCVLFSCLHEANRQDIRPLSTDLRYCKCTLFDLFGLKKFVVVHMLSVLSSLLQEDQPFWQNRIL